MIALEFEGDGFLYKMVRLMVGAVVGCAAGKEDPATVEEQLTHPSPQSFRRLVAPACGLTLVRICY